MNGYGVVVTVSKDVFGRSESTRTEITVAFQYDPLLVEKVKTIDGRKWYKDEKYWSFPDSDGIVEKILKVFEGEEIHLDPALKGTVPDFVVSAQSNDLRTEQSGVPSLVIASPSPSVILNEVKNLVFLLRVNSAKQSQHPFGAGSESGLSPQEKTFRNNRY